MRKLKLFVPALVSLSAGAVYLLVKEDLKRKEEGRVNIVDSVKENKTSLITDKEKRDAIVSLVKLEADEVANSLSKKSNEVKELFSKQFEDAEDDLHNAEKELLGKFDKLTEALKNDEDKPKRGRPRKID